MTSDARDLGSVVTLFQETMWLPDPGIVYAVLGTAAANRLPGDPTWLLVPGPPSSGKTEVLDSLSLLPEYHVLSTFTEAGLLSGSPSREGTGATGGLLRQVGEQGLMVAPDFGTLLNEHASTRNRMFALLREVFDGKITRHLGTGGGRSFAWRGHVGFLGAVTEAIDSPNIDLGLLGERFVYYRIPKDTPDDDLMACRMVDRNAGRQPEVRRARAGAVCDLFASLPFPNLLPPLSESEMDRLVTLASLGARCRSSVVRDGRNREIELVPGHERSPRLYGQLRQLYAGLATIGTTDEVLWGVLAKAALDGMHPGRRVILDYLVGTTKPHSTEAVAARCRLTTTPTRRHLQDLNAHGVLDLVGTAPECWQVSEWTREMWWAVASTHPNQELSAIGLLVRSFDLSAS
jgi:hypothetical protein